MSSANENRDAWHPQTKQDDDAILKEPREVLASPHFCHSKRYPALLEYIVENTLAGKSDLLKERTLGVEVFDRPPTYDTNADTVVRYTAGEVRKRLSLYYSQEGRNSSIRISLPAGSYIPEFLSSRDTPGETGSISGSIAHSPEDEAQEHGVAAPPTGESEAAHLAAGAGEDSSLSLHRVRSNRKLLVWMALAILLLVGIMAEFGWRRGAIPSHTVVDDFWAPVLHDQHTVLICTGGVVFAPQYFSGVVTASKDSDYPFVSMQNATAISQISGMLEHSGAATQLVFSGSEPLTELREHSVVMIGGYNNQWTSRLLEPLRFHFTPEPNESIVDQTQPQAHWSRDRSLPYSSADDYAVVARFRDPTTDGWVVVLAGLGRNGTEAASEFAISPHYLQLLKDQAGKGFANKNIEAVMKVSVIDGKTGAPSIQAVHVW